MVIFIEEHVSKDKTHPNSLKMIYELLDGKSNIKTMI